MKTKHTQGEWVLNSDNTITSGETHIARTSLGKSGIPYIQIREEEQANAKLIASAPDLLQTLERFSKAIFPNLTKEGEALLKIYQDLAKAAIKKATE